jgi:hypothetical protein
MSMAPFEPAPLRKVTNVSFIGIPGTNRRMLTTMECGHVMSEPVSRDKRQKRKRCKQCREES